MAEYKNHQIYMQINMHTNKHLNKINAKIPVYQRQTYWERDLANISIHNSLKQNTQTKAA